MIFDAELTADLFGAIGIFAAMLEERVDSGSATARDMGQTCRIISRSLGFSSLEIAAAGACGALCALDTLLRREVATDVATDVEHVFDRNATIVGGLHPALRHLGAAIIQQTKVSDRAKTLIAILSAVLAVDRIRTVQPTAPGIDDICARLLEDGHKTDIVSALRPALETLENPASGA